MPAAMPCKNQREKEVQETCRVEKKCKTKYACIVEADESTYCRKRMNSLSRYNLVHTFIPMPQAMKIPGAKAAVDKEWEKD